MTFSLNQLHWWNARLCPPLGFLLNFLLIWLILRRTPKEMRMHSRILLQTCLLDCLLLTLLTIGQPVIMSQNDSATVIFEGIFIDLFRGLRPVWLLIFFLALTTLQALNCSGISVQFLYRYLVLNRDAQVGLCRYMMMLIVPAGAYTLLACLMYENASTTLTISCDKQQLCDRNLSNPCYNNNNNNSSESITWDDASICLVYTIKHKFSGYLFMVFLTISYVVIFFCARRMIQYINANSLVGMNSRLEALNRQLTRNLIILAGLPLMLMGLQVVYLAKYYTLLSKGQPIVALDTALRCCQFIIYMSSHWLPALNPVASIFVNKPYREALLRSIKIAPTPPMNTMWATTVNTRFQE